MKDFIYKTDYYRFKLKEGILYVTYINGPITLDIAKELVKKRLDLMGKDDVWTLVDDSNLKSIDREARIFLSSDEGIKGVRAGAIVVSSIFARHLANFFLRVSFVKPKIPAKIFPNKEEALIWLENLKNQG